MGYRLFIGKNQHKKEDKHPDLILSAIDDDGNFHKVAAMWKTQNGTGYSGPLGDGVSLKIEETDGPTPQGNQDNQGDGFDGF